MTDPITAEELVFENISRLGKTLEEHREEDFREDPTDNIQHNLRMQLIFLDSTLTPLKDEKFEDNADSIDNIAELDYQGIVDRYNELSKLGFRVFGPEGVE